MTSELISTTNRRTLIPAAGFGTRVEHSGSKELLARASTGKPLIEQALEDSWQAGADPHVILRSEKVELRSHLAKVSLPLSVQEIKNSREWPETLLLSEPYWRDFNVIYLPDLEFKPRSILPEIFNLLETESFEIVVAGKKASDASAWGIVDRGCGSSTEYLKFCEKPREKKSSWAWGFVGFRRERGVELLSHFLESTFDHSWKVVLARVGYLELEELRDVTR